MANCLTCGRFTGNASGFCDDHDWDGPVDSDGAPCRFINHYECGKCGHKWQDQWSSMCDDDCPNCGARHWTPTHSEDA